MVPVGICPSIGCGPDLFFSCIKYGLSVFTESMSIS
jgi:hypothetical protein